MASLLDTLRRQLEKTVVEAREVAEIGARAAIERLAVDRSESFAEMAPVERELRVGLRAHARQLGDPRKENGEQEIRRLVSECAYEHWHRMLFARFLAESHLLIHPEHRVPVTLAECQELAAEAGEENGWALAGRFAARMLPAIFRPDDPVLSVRLAPEHQQALEILLVGIPVEVFTADDSLGWVYQFWQTKRKKEVNESGNKIGADELPAVTQLFTEPYMVQFLLHNTLGAWWAGKVLAGRPELAQTAQSEAELRGACALPGCEWTYLRFVRAEDDDSWRPAATFQGWPERAAQITVLDPCCGSGHFLVEAFRILVAIRVAEEGLPVREACALALRDNLFGLEIDERCTQIAAFNLALAAWTHPDASGYRPLPELHVACSGLTVGAKEEEWLKLAVENARLRDGMRRLYRLFKDAPTLGSLIDPRREFEARPGELEFDKGRFDELRPLLDQALAREEVRRDAQATEAGIAAQGMAKAAALLADSYTLVATNVPYLTSGSHHESLKRFLEVKYETAKVALETSFSQRCLEFSQATGCSALVSQQYWMFLPSYEKFRRKLLAECSLQLIVRLGPGAFRAVSGENVNVALHILTNSAPTGRFAVQALDVSSEFGPGAKSTALLTGQVLACDQASQMANAGARITLDSHKQLSLVQEFATPAEGLSTGDRDRFICCIWEQPRLGSDWVFIQGAPEEADGRGGLHELLRWERGEGEMTRSQGARIQGLAAWRKPGVLIARVGSLRVAEYQGHAFDKKAVVLTPSDPRDTCALLEFARSPEFIAGVRRLDKKTYVTTSVFGALPFDAQRWRAEAIERHPSGLPEPYSDDPTQWLFHGRPEASTAPLQVSVSRLLGYLWPSELDEGMRLSQRARDLVQRCNELLELADGDGIVCIPPVRGEQPAADRLQRLLALAFGTTRTSVSLSALLADVGFSGKTLEDWLRDGFFEQHCQLFHHRPFVWHIWDGRRRDGFAALVNYHRLDRKLLERLAYTVLGDWISDQRQGAKSGERGAEDRLAAADALQQKLALILEGEPPHDIFVRWKALHEQPLGWAPDFNDGVRMNIRPFVVAGVLRKNPRVQWAKDRGSDPEHLRPMDQFPWFWNDGQFTGERVNDIHLTSAERREARERASRERSAAR